MRILILHDVIPDDARIDVADALVQAEFIGAALSRMDHSFERLAFTADLSRMRSVIGRAAPDVVFNLVESVGGEGRLIHLAPSLLDSMQLPYTGARTEAMFLTSNKLLTKRWLAANGLATPGWYGGPRDRGAESYPGTYIIKSVWEDASIGLDDASLVNAGCTVDLVREIAVRRERLGGEAFGEAYVDGREFNISLLATNEPEDRAELLPPAEIEFVDYKAGKPKIVGYAAKWDEESFEYRNTRRRLEFARTDAILLETMAAIAQRCWRIFGLRGYARVDFRVDAAGKPWVLELNANPCLSPDAGFMAAAARAGIPAASVVERIVRAALEGDGPA